MKLGSLFDGSGGFPLAAQLVGISTAWRELQRKEIKVD